MNFIYDGKSSKDFNLVITKVKRHDTPERDIENIKIPGKNGTLTLDNGSYGSRKIEIEAYIKSDVSKNSKLITSWLYRNFENKILFFDDEPDIYYEGKCVNNISFSETFKYFNVCNIIFECLPYKKTFDGDRSITITSNNSELYNPTYFESDPIIKIYGNGNIDLIINNKKIILIDVVNHIIIDSKLMDCYKDSQLLNNSMYGDFPKLKEGTNIINWIGNVSKIEITPNWGWI